MERMSHVRWGMVALLFFATTINYLDRIVLSVLIPVIEKELSLSKVDYGYVTGAFQLAYTVGFLFMGKFIDRFGTRIGYAVAIVWWSLAAMAHAAARGVLGLAFWRAMLGLGEAGNFPAAIKSVAEWFPKKDRAFATGIFNAGTNVASMIGPPLFVWMNAHVGWRGCFLITGALGFVWLVVWLWQYRLPELHPRVSRRELDYIRSDREEVSQPQVGWLEALRIRQTWGFATAKFLTDPVWWFYLFWLPPYLYDVRKFDLKAIGWALPVVYLMADVGSVAGGWLSGYLMRRGWPHARARKTAMAVCAAAMPVAALAVLAPNPILAVALVSLATAAHQGWSANLFTTTSDVFPRNAVASVTGIGGCAGGLGGVLFSAVIPGFVITYFGYTPVFLVLGCFHLTALLLLHKLMGEMRPVAVEAPDARGVRKG
ncbi:MAG: MFS transporter [Bryobacterales bacterium]|nr:MFS transporter [Bryobacteraceae bacterium]MDW8353469.1 MFS transporter [Bryobacterales bacterium]